MRCIKKLEPPEDYINWVTNFKVNNRKSPSYSSIPQRYKDMLKSQFIKEQKGLCCYCCGRISFAGSHIEHFYPQTLCKVQNRKEQTNYYNMFSSCYGYIENLSEFEREFCGHRKDNWYDEQKMISPLEEDCSSYFTYSSQGVIKAKDNNDKAIERIKCLGLDEYVLNEARKMALEAIGYFEEDFDKESAEQIAEQEDEDGYLPSFCNIIEYFACK